MKYCLIIAIMVLLVGCTYKPKVGSPFMQELMSQGPDGPIEFKEGWRDGCETGVSVTSNVFQRHFYSFKQDPDKAQDRKYYTGWKTAFWLCSRHVMQYLRRPLF
jgi:hypothetical protein